MLVWLMSCLAGMGREEDIFKLNKIDFQESEALSHRISVSSEKLSSIWQWWFQIIIVGFYTLGNEGLLCQ